MLPSSFLSVYLLEVSLVTPELARRSPMKMFYKLLKAHKTLMNFLGSLLSTVHYGDPPTVHEGVCQSPLIVIPNKKPADQAYIPSVILLGQIFPIQKNSMGSTGHRGLNISGCMNFKEFYGRLR